MSFSKEVRPIDVSFERKETTPGQPNPKYVDILEVDKPIAGQNFCCISFVSPEKILKQKEMFFFQEFLNKWEFSKAMEKFVQFLNFVSFKYKLTFEDITKDFKDFLEEEKASLTGSSLEDDYKTFLDKNEDRLEKEFNVKFNFQTSIRGLKIRGSFPTQEEAELRCKMLREMDPYHDILVGPVGMWMPWDPEAYRTGRVEYMEEELNQLMHEKTKNESLAKNDFDQRIKESKKKAIEENMKNAEKSGNVLTQTVDNDGNLVGINNVNTQENVFNSQETISAADIRKELFEGENIVMGKTDNGQSELISGPFATKKND
uniref:Uncharacterized protein n=1 Tax=viral metagenome TaxID=1070528 RepID=A0A6C0F3L3_9ZZZZ